jgi:hypothetical protein
LTVEAGFPEAKSLKPGAEFKESMSKEDAIEVEASAGRLSPAPKS